MRSSFEEVGYLISYMVVSSMLESLTALCNRGRLCKPNAEGIILYLIYNICKFIPYAKAPPTEAEKLIAAGNPRQVKRTENG